MVIMSIQDIEKRVTAYRELIEISKNQANIEQYERFSMLYKSYEDMRTEYYKDYVYKNHQVISVNNIVGVDNE